MCVCVCFKYVILNLSIPWDLRPSVASPNIWRSISHPPPPISWIQTIILSDTQSCVFKDSSSKPPRFSPASLLPLTPLLLYAYSLSLCRLFLYPPLHPFYLRMKSKVKEYDCCCCCCGPYHEFLWHQLSPPPPHPSPLIWQWCCRVTSWRCWCAQPFWTPSYCTYICNMQGSAAALV